MKHMKFLSFFLGVTFSIVACSSNNEIIPVPDVDPDGDDGTTEVEFAKGADIGWVTEYESKGRSHPLRRQSRPPRTDILCQTGCYGTQFGFHGLGRTVCTDEEIL